MKTAAFMAALVAAFAAGVAFQKLYGVDRLLRDLGVRNQLTDQLHGRDSTSLPPSEPERLMVALAFGQSNSANYAKPRTASSLSTLNFYDGRLYRARDPMIGADGMGGSVWPRLGDRLQQAGLYDTVVLSTIGVGDSQIRRWAPGGDLHPSLMDAIDALAAADLPITHLLWHQGESDATAGTRPEEYRRAFTAMLQSIRDRGVDAPLYVSLATRCYANPGDPALRAAQQGLVSATDGIRPGPDTDTLGPRFRRDGCHFSAAGLTAAAELWLQALSASPPAPR